jgi:hypothetical protein
MHNPSFIFFIHCRLSRESPMLSLGSSRGGFSLGSSLVWTQIHQGHCDCGSWFWLRTHFRFIRNSIIWALSCVVSCIEITKPQPAILVQMIHTHKWSNSRHLWKCLNQVLMGRVLGNQNVHFIFACGNLWNSGWTWGERRSDDNKSWTTQMLSSLTLDTYDMNCMTMLADNSVLPWICISHLVSTNTTDDYRCSSCNADYCKDEVVAAVE